MIKKITPVAIYTRKSTNTDSKQTISLARQTTEIKIFCDSHNLIIVKEFSESVSAKDNNRPEFKKLLDWLDQSANNIVVISNVSRLARNLRIWEHIENRLHQFRFVEMGINVPTMFMVNSYLSVATQERINISNRVKASYQVLKAKFGDDLKWGNPNIGEYSNKANEKKTELMQEHWKQILYLDALLFSKYRHTMTQVRRVEILNDMGARTRRGKKITPQSLSRAHRKLETGGVRLLAEMMDQLERET